MHYMYSYKLWTLVDLPKAIISIKCKWNYKWKAGMDRKVEIFEARLAMKRYTQR